MDGQRRKHPASTYALVASLAFQGLSGIAGGYGLVADPTGEALGIPLSWLEGSPFGDYLVPGVVLLTLLGVAPLVVSYGVWSHRRWSWLAALVVGIALLGWLGVEMLVIGYQPEPPLQLIYGVVGTAIVLLALSPSVRRDLGTR